MRPVPRNRLRGALFYCFRLSGIRLKLGVDADGLADVVETVALEQFGKDDAPLRLLDDERPELGHDEPLVRPEILRYGLNQHD